MGLLTRLRQVATLLADPRVRRLPRLAVLFAAAYLLWPLDLFPDFLVPVAGYLDDLVLVWMSVRWLFRSAPPGEVAPAATLSRSDADR